MDLRISELKFGTVRSIDGNKIVIKADTLKKELNQTPYHVEVGSFINCGSVYHGDTICIVTRIQVEEVERRNGEIDEIKIVELSIVGSVDEQNHFTRGIDQLPAVASDAYLLTGEQVNNLIGITERDKNVNKNAKYFKVGKWSMRGGGDAYFNLDKLLGRHVAIVGTTGSGKSSTVARITQSILRDYPYPRMVFFDIHNEYQSAFSGEWSERSNCIAWKDFKLPYWFLDLEEFIAIYYPEAGGTQRMHIKEIIERLKRENITDPKLKDKISVDSPVYFDINNLIQEIEKIKKQQTASKQDPFDKMIIKIESKNNDSRFSFLKGKAGLTLEEYFRYLLGLNPDKSTYITVLDLSGLPAEIRTISVGVLTRLFFDYCYWDLDPENLPIALVLEEAHTYIPEDTSSTYSLCLERVERVAKEGRKYGLSLVVVTQRPSNVSSTVLSQCGTFITLRLTNDVDQNKIRRLLPDNLGDQASILPSLRDGEALVTGDAVMLPGRVRFEEPSPHPKSNDVRFHKAWSEGPPIGYDVEAIIQAWKMREKSEIEGSDNN